MIAYDRLRLADVFDQGLSDGIDALTPADRELFRIKDFTVDFEMGGLSSYLYNRLPDLDDIRETVVAMRRHGLVELANLLSEAVGLFANYVDADPPTTWGLVLQRYDPTGRLDELHKNIDRLDNYGMGYSPMTNSDC